MPAIEALTARGQQWREWLPVRLRESPDHLAVLHALARECERLEEKIEQVRAQFFPQTADILLAAYEAELGTTIEPEGVALDERRQLVLALLARMRSSAAGRDWEADVTRMVGPGWTYEEHDPADPTSPPEYTVLVRLPFAPTSSRYAQVERELREMTPAHLDLQVQYSGGFVLDESQLDQEGLA